MKKVITTCGPCNELKACRKYCKEWMCNDCIRLISKIMARTKGRVHGSEYPKLLREELNRK